ncbi:MAG: TolC family protein [Acidobacteriota bacterium]|nr:TolC family protein [Acidobacteriota bacterium]
MSGKTTRVAPDPTHGHTLTAGGEADCRRGEAVCRRAARCARFVLLASVLTLLCAAHGLFVVAVRAQTPVATPTPARQQTRPPGGEQNQPAPPEARPAPQNPSAPPGASSLPPPQMPPGADESQQAGPPAPAQMPATDRLLNELKQDPSMHSDDVRPTPPVPNYTRVGVEGDDVLVLSLNEAIRRALENNSDIEVARGDVRVAEGTLRSLEGVYDPVFTFNPQFTSSVTPTTSSIGGAGSNGIVTQNSQQFDSTVTKQFATGGGNYQFFFNNLRQSTSSTLSRLNPFYSASLGVTFTQPLWRNRSIDTYRHAIRVQRKKLGQTDAEFRLRTTQIIDQVQHAYWELGFALHARQVAVDSLNLAREQFRVTEQGVAAGTTAPLGRAEVDTEIANREADLLAATKNVTLAEDTFKQLVLRDPSAPEWRASIMPTDEPSFDLTPADLDEALKEARDNRPELRNLRLQEEINQIDLQFASNQTRPRVDIVSTVSTTGLAGSAVSTTPTDITTGLSGSTLVNGQVPLITGDPASSANAFLLSQINQLRASQGLPAAQVPLITPAQVNPNLVGGYGQTLRNLSTLGTRNIIAGVTIEFPLRNRAAEGNLAVARAQRDQLVASLHSQEQAVELDVRNTVQTLETARQTVLTTRQASRSAELQLAGELQLFRAGQSTTFLVFQRENTLATARNAELRAEADYNNALADLQRATGTTITANNVVIETPAGP